MIKNAMIVGMVALASGAMASVYDNGGPDFQNGNEMTQWLQTEDFVLNASANVTGATFVLLNTLVGSNNSNWDGSLQWYIFDTNGGIPGSVIATGNAQNIQISFNSTGFWDFYDVSFNFGQSVALNSGTTYHFGLHMAADYNSRDELYWASTANNATQTGWESDGGTMNNWSNNGVEHAFTLVPAPGAMALLGLGAVAGLRRRR